MADDLPFDANRKLARKLYVELITRITTQPMHFMHGVEDTALQSIVDFFRLTRTAIVDAGPNAALVGDIATKLLNDAIRPFTAHWHKAISDGVFDQEDTRAEFRRDMDELQGLLRQYSDKLNDVSKSSNLDEVKSLCGNWNCPALVTKNKPFNDQPVPRDRILSFEATSGGQLNRLAKEAVAIDSLRHELNRSKDEPLAGLAISGGGLRSATFSLGVLQGLVKSSLFPRFDYLSTVSGGGYLGSLLTTLINSSPDYDLKRKGFGRTENCESDVLRHLRAHSKFLIAGGWKKRLHIPVLAVYGWICTAAILLPLIAFCSLVIYELSIALTGFASINNASLGRFPYTIEGSYRPFLICVVLLLPIILLPILRWSRPEGYRSDRILTVFGFFLAAVGVICLSLLLPLMQFILARIQVLLGGGLNWAVLGTVAAAVIPFLGNLRNHSKRGSSLRVISQVLLITLPFLLLLSAALGWISIDQIENTKVRWLIVIVLVSCVLSWPFLDINDFSLHPFYRSRLANTYLVRPNITGKLQGGASVKLSESRIENSRAPYHIINASLNAGESTAPEIRGRIADFFEFSPDFCGAESIGYAATDAYEEKNKELDLATAMAISGGAASPYMGVNSSATKFLFALLNIRLDYWLSVPGRDATWKDRAPSQLIRQMLGMLDEKSAAINLSDGGHIENLGVYTLLKRRCKLIVAIDGECDPQISCSSLIQAMRYAEIDFGIKIDIDLNRLKSALWDKTPDVDGTAARSPFTRYHFSLGTINYGTYEKETGDKKEVVKEIGYLLYIKSSMTGNEPDMLMRYKQNHIDFPHQSTGDLFYNEEQFECYRALGEHIVQDILDFSNFVPPTPPTPPADPLMDLFKSLHQKLSDPAKN